MCVRFRFIALSFEIGVWFKELKTFAEAGLDLLSTPLTSYCKTFLRHVRDSRILIKMSQVNLVMSFSFIRRILRFVA